MVSVYRIIAVVIGIAAASAGTANAATDSADKALIKAQSIIDYIDKGRSADSPFEIILKVTKESDRSAFSYRLVDNGKDRSVLYFLDKRQQGQKVLATDKETWFFSNRTRRAIKIPAAQKLFGDASIGDIARLRFSVDYVPTAVSAEGEELILSLTSKHPAATYQTVKLKVGKTDRLPLEAQFYAASGKHLKTAIFTVVSIEDDTPVINEWKLFTPGREKSATLVQASDFALVSLPAIAFTKPYLSLMNK